MLGFGVLAGKNEAFQVLIAVVNSFVNRISMANSRCCVGFTTE